MKKIFALSLSLIMFSAFASVNNDYGGENKDEKQKTEITQTIPVVADTYQVTELAVVNFIDEQIVEVSSQTNITLSESKARLSSVAPILKLFRRTDYEISCNLKKSK